MWRNFRFLLICHVQKFEISPHDRFSLHGHRPCVRDKYEVCPLPPTKKKQRDDKDILASTIKLSKSHGVNLRGLKGFLISTKFRGSSSHFHVDHVIIVDFYLALTSHVFYPINLKLVFWGLQTTDQVPSKARSPTPKFFFGQEYFSSSGFILWQLQMTLLYQNSLCNLWQPIFF